MYQRGSRYKPHDNPPQRMYKPFKDLRLRKFIIRVPKNNQGIHYVHNLNYIILYIIHYILTDLTE